MPETLVLVILDHGTSLAVESGEALSEGFNIVVRTLDEGLPRDVVDQRLFRWAAKQVRVSRGVGFLKRSVRT